MGIRINKAIGYGMDIKTFQQCSPLLEKMDKMGGMWDAIYNTLNKVKDLRACSNDEFQEKYALNKSQRVFYHPNDSSSSCSLYDLVKFVGYEDPYTDILFIPSTANIDRWYRYDDDIDYAEERWYHNITRGDDASRLEDVVKYVPYGHYPYTNNLMDVDGNNIKWTCSSQYIGKEDTILPEPPPVLTYWTQKMGVLNKQGVLNLKPMIATWWS